MHFKSILGIGLTILLSTVNAGKSCEYLEKYRKDINFSCFSDDNVPTSVWFRSDVNNTILNDVAKLTSLTEVDIRNESNVDLDLSILKKLKKMKTFLYSGEINDTILKSISKLTTITDLTIENTGNGNLNLKPLKNLKLKKLDVNCNNVDSDSANYITPKTLSVFASTLKELYIGDCLIDKKENLSSLTKVTYLNANGWIDSTLYKKAAAMKSVKTIRLYIQKTNVGMRDIYEIDVSDLQSAPKLVELQISSALSRYRDRVRVKVGSLKGFKQLKSLYFHAIAFTQENIDEISKMKNLESLTFNGDPLVDDEETEVTPTYDSLVNLKSNLKYLSYDFPKKTVYDSDKFSEFPEFILSLTNLRNLTINESYIKSVPENIVKLKKLEHLDLSSNKLYTLPDSINNLKKLKYIDVSRNGNLNGNTLNSNKIEYCNYSGTNMCIDEEVKCLKEDDTKLSKCSSECSQFNEYLMQVKNVTTLYRETCVDSEEGKAEAIAFSDNEIEEDIIDKLLAFKDTVTKLYLYWYGDQKTLEKISVFTNVQELHINIYDKESETLDLSPLNNLVKLENLVIYNESEKNNEIKEGSLDKLTNLYNIRFERISLTQGLVNDIGNLTNLGVLDINYSSFPKDLDYDSWKNLTNVYYLYIRRVGVDGTPLTEIPKAIYSMTNLSRMTINYQKITTIDSDVANLKRLSDIEMSDNDMTSLPIELNTMESLYTINFQQNPNLKGEVVDNDNIYTCFYDRSNKICKPRENIKCFDNLVVPNNLSLCN